MTAKRIAAVTSKSEAGAIGRLSDATPLPDAARSGGSGCAEEDGDTVIFERTSVL
jgi:hypothetical protein